MKEYSRYYIAFLDLLGFKEIVKAKTCSEIVDIFEEIKLNMLLEKWIRIMALQFQ